MKNTIRICNRAITTAVMMAAMCVILVMVKPQDVSAKEYPSQQDAYNAIMSLQDEYPEGMPWTNANYYGWKGGIYSGGSGCAGFAFRLSDEAFGELKARKYYDYSQVRVGDILRINNDSHSVIILEVNEDGVVVAEGNYNSSVHWGRKFSWDKINEVTVYAMTRYTDVEEEEQPEISDGLHMSASGQWNYYRNGSIDTGFTGLASNEYGWWYIKNGAIDFSYTGMAANEYGWWYVENGAINFNYTGMALNEYGWWYMQNGALNLSYTGLALNEYGWWYMQNGALNLSYTGLAANEYGWWYVENGVINFNYTGLALNEYGWWYVENGAINFNYTGMALNEYGWWYVRNGAIDFSYTGNAVNQYGTWHFENGMLTGPAK